MGQAVREKIKKWGPPFQNASNADERETRNWAAARRVHSSPSPVLRLLRAAADEHRDGVTRGDGDGDRAISRRRGLLQGAPGDLRRVVRARRPR
jgi:hypothetical protein